MSAVGSTTFPPNEEPSFVVPSITTLYEGIISPWFIAAICVAVVLLSAIVYIYWRTVENILCHTHSDLLSRTLVLVSAYPIVGIISMASLLVPNAAVFCETVSHFTYAMMIYQIFCMVVDYAGGETEMITATNGEQILSMRTKPCCCCCIQLRPTQLTKKTVRRLRLMALQVPIVQGTVLFSLNIVNLSDAHLYDLAVLFTLPIMFGSILTGEWCLKMLTEMLQPLFVSFRLKQKFLAIQLILIAVKFQAFIANEILKAIHIENPDYPTTPRVFMNAILQVLLLSELLLLALWSRRLYQYPRCSNSAESISVSNTNTDSTM